MKLKHLVLECTAAALLIFPIVVCAQSIEFQEDAVFEVQTKGLTNSDMAKDNGQDWSNDQLSMIYSNIDFGLKLFEHKFNASWFFRHSSSDLFQDERPALNYSLFPQKIIARDFFKIQYVKETQTTRTESILNKFTYEFGDEDFHFKLGRMYVNYGDGFMANPMNPYNLAGFSGAHAKFNQANDGMQVKIQNDERLILKVFIFQDRSYRNYDDEKMTRTFMLHGDWKYKPDTNVQYILGEDQKRHKYGLQIKKTFEQAMAYAQVVRFSQRLDKQDAYEKGLNHFIAGAEKKFSDKLTTRIEVGRQEFSENLDEANHLAATFIPLNRFVALANTYDHSDKHNTAFVVAHDTDSKFAFANIEHTYIHKKGQDVFVRYLAPFSEPDEDKTLTALQRIVASEISLGLRLLY